MRLGISLAVILVIGSGTPWAWAQSESKVGKVAARPTGIEVTSPFTDPSKLPPDLAKQFDSRVIEYVEKMLRDYDENNNGLLDKDELAKGRWTTPPEESDTNKDGSLSKQELCLRIAKRFGLEVPVNIAANAADAKPTARKLIAFEFVVIERVAADLAGGKDKAPTAEELLKLEKDGKASVQRYKLAALENVEARLQLGEDAPFVSGRSFGGGRGGFAGGSSAPVQEQVTYNSIGTTITVTAETETDGKVLASINLARSSVAAPPKAPEKAEGQEAGVSANYPRRLQSTVVSTIRIAPGEPALIAAQQSHTGTSPGELWVLVMAKVE